MAKKKNKKGEDAPEDASVEQTTGADEEASAESADEPVVPEAAAPVRAEGGEDHWRQLFNAWPVDPDHESATEVLRNNPTVSDVDLEDAAAGQGGNTFLNLALLVLILGAGGVGAWQLRAVSSAEALEAKRIERERVEQEHLQEQLAKQKKYGVLRVESNPPQADVFRNGEKIVSVNEATGEQIVGRTPINMMNVEIAGVYQIRVEKEGYEPFEFNVAEHLWTKDSASGDYKFFKMVELTPNTCEYWFLYDAKKKRELRFEDQLDPKTKEVVEAGKGKCQEHYDSAVAGGVSVTECTCKLPENPPEEGKQ